MVSGGLLEGVRVVDLSGVLAGPYAASVLAEMGADVIKVEPPAGDVARAIGPHLNGVSTYFASLNTGKRGIVLDLTTDSAGAALDLLLERADIMVSNFLPSTAAKLRCDPVGVAVRHPQLVIVSITGYASDSDRSEEGAFDLIAQAESGIMSVTGEPGRPPVRAGVAISDLVTGLWGAMAATAGLAARDRDGKGRILEVPLLDSSLPLLSYMATSALATGQAPDRVGSGHHAIAPYGAYSTADGWIVLAAIGDRFWLPLCRALDLPAAAHTERLATNAGRAAGREAVDELISAAVAPMTSRDAIRRLKAAGVPTAPINNLLEALSTPYVQAQGLVADVNAQEGSYRVIQGPLRTGPPQRPAPRLGEHTEEILREILPQGSHLLEDLIGLR